MRLRRWRILAWLVHGPLANLFRSLGCPFGSSGDECDTVAIFREQPPRRQSPAPLFLGAARTRCLRIPFRFSYYHEKPASPNDVGLSKINPNSNPPNMEALVKVKSLEN